MTRDLRMALLVIVLTACPLILSEGAMPENKLPADVEETLQRAESLEVLALDPVDIAQWNEGRKFPVTDPKTRKGLLEALRRGIAGSDGAMASCFHPRHGIRAVHGGQKVELIICFQCRKIRIYTGTAEVGLVLTNNEPEPVFDETIRQLAALPVADTLTSQTLETTGTATNRMPIRAPSKMVR